MYNAESTHKHTPNDSNNIESNDFVANRLLLFEHVRMPKDTDLLRSNSTRSYNFEVCKDDDALRSNSTRSYNFEVGKDDDASDGSVVCQPEVLQQVPRDVLNNNFGPMTCIVFHFHSYNYNH